MVLIVPPSLSHYSLEGEDRGPDEEVGKYCGDGLLGYGDDEVRVSDVWEMEDALHIEFNFLPAMQ